jgi:hypothetical protein
MPKHGAGIAHSKQNFANHLQVNLCSADYEGKLGLYLESECGKLLQIVIGALA